MKGRGDDDHPHGASIKVFDLGQYIERGYTEPYGYVTVDLIKLLHVLDIYINRD